MRHLIPWLWAAGALQLVIIAGNFVLPKKVRCGENLVRVSPMIREVFILLTGTSRYRNRMWPASYWRLWSDAIVHQIHARVFRQIKRLAEEEQLQAVVQQSFGQ